MKAHRIFVLSTICLGLVGFSSTARAGGIDILKSIRQADGKLLPPTAVFNDPRLLNQALENAFRRDAKNMEKAVRDYLGKGDLLARGVTLYDINVRVGKPSFRLTSANSFEFVIRGNYMYFHTTTPTDLGKWADPAFQLEFDLRLRSTLSLPTSRNPRFRVVSSVLDVPHLTIKPRNFTGGVATTVAVVTNSFVKLVTGRDYIRRAADKYLHYDCTKALNARLDNVNNVLARLYKEGYRDVNTTFDQARQMLNVLMTKRMVSVHPGTLHPGTLGRTKIR
jgi:hypothetical protein